MSHSNADAERRVLHLVRSCVAIHLNRSIPVQDWPDLFGELDQRVTRDRKLNDRIQELMQAGLLAWLEAAAKEPCIKFDCGYLRPIIEAGIRKADYEDRCLYTPLATRQKRLQRGSPAGDIRRHDVPEFQYTLSPDDIPLIEKYRRLYAVCRDDIDRRFLEASFDSDLVPDLEWMQLKEIPRPPHLKDLARVCGISLEAAGEVAEYLYQSCAYVLQVPVPKGRREGGRPRKNRKQQAPKQLAG